MLRASCASFCVFCMQIYFVCYDQLKLNRFCTKCLIGYVKFILLVHADFHSKLLPCVALWYENIYCSNYVKLIVSQNIFLLIFALSLTLGQIPAWAERPYCSRHVRCFQCKRRMKQWGYLCIQTQLYHRYTSTKYFTGNCILNEQKYIVVTNFTLF